MYTAAELFNLATKADAKEVFLSNVTMSIPDDLPGCANLDAEKDRLSKIWDVAHMSINEMVAAVGLSKTNFAKETGIPFMSDSKLEPRRENAACVHSFLLAEHFGCSK